MSHYNPDPVFNRPFLRSESKRGLFRVLNTHLAKRAIFHMKHRNLAKTFKYLNIGLRKSCE